MTDSTNQDVTSTGHERVDAILERLHGLDDQPVEQHAAVYHEVHDELRTYLEQAGTEGGSGSAQ